MVGHLKSVNAGEGKCLSWGYDWTSDDGQDYDPRFAICNDELEQNIVFCDDGSIRNVANDSYCLSKPGEGEYGVKNKPCSFGADGSIDPK